MNDIEKLKKIIQDVRNTLLLTSIGCIATDQSVSAGLLHSAFILTGEAVRALDSTGDKDKEDEKLPVGQVGQDIMI